MKIGIDARKIGPYVSSLLRALSKQKGNQYVLFFDSRIPQKQAEKYRAKNVDIKCFPFSRYRKFMRQAYSQILVSAFIAKERLDIFHATAGTMPLVYNGKSILNIWKIEKGKAAKALQKNICKKAQIIIVSSKNCQKKLINNYKIRAEKILLMEKPQAKEVFNLYEKIAKKRRKRKRKKSKK